jgi:DNA-binding response OmpR family regulator
LDIGRLSSVVANPEARMHCPSIVSEDMSDVSNDAALNGVQHLLKTTRSALKVLIVQNDVESSMLVRQHLQSAGFTVSVAQSGDKARREIQSAAADLLLLDLLLPDISGLDLCRWIRSRADTAGIPIIILTAKNTETDKVLGLYAGADDYMTKPFSIAELEARIHALMRRARLFFQPGTQSVYKCGWLRINFTTYELFIIKACII